MLRLRWASLPVYSGGGIHRRHCYRYLSSLPPSKRSLREHGLAPAYEPEVVESDWYDWWLKNDCFKPSSTTTTTTNTNTERMILPPPNVTGALHIGHALTNSIQDALVRYYRMCGQSVQWMPGLDHAGIATQTVVEKSLLRKHGIKRAQLSRDDFVTRVWEWRQQYGDRINEQQRRLGSSLDWDAEYFTLDEQRSEAVVEAFVRLHQLGLIERGQRLVNWDCYLGTTISDIEVDTIDIPPHGTLSLPGRSEPVEFGVLHNVAYRVEKNHDDDDDDGNDDDEVIVSTTRLETMFADVAVAVHSTDTRYQRLHGKYLIQPLTGRRLPVIVDDELVDPALGSGAVKITPAHDVNDYACGQRHGFTTFPSVIGDDGRLNATAGVEFAGMDRFEARAPIVAALKACDAYRGGSGHAMRVAVCSRSGDVLEPLVKPQWFVKMESLAKRAVNAVESGELQLLPLKSGYDRLWREFLSRTGDWCVSRQLWWGHRIPAYRVVRAPSSSASSAASLHQKEEEEEWVVARSIAEAHTVMHARHGTSSSSSSTTTTTYELVQDSDVLDTWFSSGLLPLSCNGWPRVPSPPPLTLMETGADILFFWVARMVMMNLALHGDAMLPFKRVLLHPMVCDSEGKKMSKSRGNVLDPMDIIHGVGVDKLLAQVDQGNLSASEVRRAHALLRKELPNGIPACGADALRFALCHYTRGGSRHINLDIDRVHHFRLFCNKMYQACRFVLHHHHHHDDMGQGDDRQHVVNLWIRSRLAACAMDCEAALNASSLDVGAAADRLHQFFQVEVCDQYIEFAKILLRCTDDQQLVAATKATLHHVMTTSVRLFHPFMPYLTEELWQALHHHHHPHHHHDASVSSIMRVPYPTSHEVQSWLHPAAETMMNDINAIVSVVRSTCAQHASFVDSKVLYWRQEVAQPSLPSPSSSSLIIDKHGELLCGLLRLSEAIIVMIDGEDATHTEHRIMWRLMNLPSGTTVHLGFRVNSAAHLTQSIARMEKNAQKVAARVHALKGRMNAPGYEERVPVDVHEKNQQNLENWTRELQDLQTTIQEYKDI